MAEATGTEDVLLQDEFLRELMSVGEVDLLIGLPTHNHARSIGPAIAAIEESLQKDFWRDRGLILNVDAGPRDGTPAIVLDGTRPLVRSERGLTSLRTVHRISTRYRGPSSGLALRTILAAADLTRAKGCAIVWPGSGALSSEGVTALLRPVRQQGFDFVAPLYRRERFDGLLARTVLYPVFRAAFGRRIRELHTGEFAFSGRLVAACLGEDAASGETMRAWPEAWLATSAQLSGMNCCQAYVGPREPPTASGGAIVGVVREAVGALFSLLEDRQGLWMGTSGSQSLPTFGPDHEMGAEANRTARGRILEMFRSGVAELTPILENVLEAQTLMEIRQLAGARAAGQADSFGEFGCELWARAIYEFAAAFHRRALHRDHLVQAFVPIYRGYIGSFLARHQGSSGEQIEAETEELCLACERLKPYWMERWKGSG